MADLSELQGEVLALRCFVAALISTASLSQQLRVWPAFNHYSELVQGRLDEAARAAFKEAVVRIPVRRLHNDQQPAATPLSCPQSS